MKTKLSQSLAFGAATLLLLCSLPRDSSGQSETNATAVNALLLEVQAQQKVIADNQTKIDVAMAEVAENVRVARIFISRGGK